MAPIIVFNMSAQRGQTVSKATKKLGAGETIFRKINLFVLFYFFNFIIQREGGHLHHHPRPLLN